MEMRQQKPNTVTAREGLECGAEINQVVTSERQGSQGRHASGEGARFWESLTQTWQGREECFL